MKEAQAKANQGEVIDFRGDFHLAAVLIKAFLRELEEPILTFDLFDEVMDFQSKSLFLFTNFHLISHCHIEEPTTYVLKQLQNCPKMKEDLSSSRLFWRSYPRIIMQF